MKKRMVLSNQNKILYEHSDNVTESELGQDLAIRTALNGFEEYVVAGKRFRVSPGSFLITNNGTPFNREIYSHLPAHTLSLLYSPSYVNSFYYSLTASEYSLLNDPFRADHVDMDFLETLYPCNTDMLYNFRHLRDSLDNLEDEELLINQYLYHALFNFYRVYQHEIIEKSKQLKVCNAATRLELFKRLNNAKDYMLSNYNSDLSMEEISNYACLSESHFFRTFRQVFRTTPHQYLMQLRLMQAKHMLKSSSYGLFEIISMVGFDNQSSFIRLFKNRFGVTPGRFRKGIAA